MSEHQTLAQFLRERCARNKYGLRYLDPVEKTLLYIPWPVAPRPNEEIPAGFKMYREWAEISFRKRGNSQAAEIAGEIETYAYQKHRFRNALDRANGIDYRKEIKMEGARVYEFVATRRSNKAQCQERTGADPLNDEDFIDELLSPVSLSQDGSNVPGCAQQQVYDARRGSNDVFNGYGRQPYLPDQSSFYQNNAQQPLHVPAITDTPTTSNPSNVTWTNGIHTERNGSDGMLMDLGDIFNGVPQNQTMPVNPRQNYTPGGAQRYSLGMPIRPTHPEEQSHLCIKLRFRQEEAFTFHVTERKGCRVYYGTNFPNLSQLLEREHLQNIMSMFRFEPAAYYGPDNLQQVKLPSPDQHMKSQVQTSKTNAILTNMDRGLILYLEEQNTLPMNIPDVYAMRLCQTRIFPSPEFSTKTDLNNVPAQVESLRRMQWTKVFDGRSFCEKFANAEQAANNPIAYPSPTFSLSLGQKPPGPAEERPLLLVCLTVTVQRAHQLIQSRLDNDGHDVCISGLTSMDEEARILAAQLTETLTL